MVLNNYQARGQAFIIMSKDPAVLFYTSDFLTGTLTMSNEDVGKYIRLLCLQHQKGLLTEQDMLYICIAYVESIYSKFEKTSDGFYFNKRMQEETNKRVAYSDSRRKNVNTRYDKAASTYVVHMENENANEIKDVIEVRIESFKKEINLHTEYPSNILNDFFSYWSEPNRSKKKMRYELQPTWDLSRRLATWANREKMVPQKKFGRQEVSVEDLNEQSKINLSDSHGVVPWMNQPSS